MHNKTILKISLTISIIGIILLLILANTIHPAELKIKEITIKYLDKKIQTKGIITSIKTYKESNFQILTINDNNKSIDITLNPIQNFTKNQTIRVIGTLKQYKENLQIQADKIVENY